jgi:hypothetical protein
LSLDRSPIWPIGDSSVARGQQGGPALAQANTTYWYYSTVNSVDGIIGACEMARPSSNKGGYSNLQTSDVDTSGVQRREPANVPQGRTAKQKRWVKLLAAAFVADLVVCALLKQAEESFPLWGESKAPALDDTTDNFSLTTQDLLSLSYVRVALTAAFAALALRIGVIKSGNADVLPHNLTKGDLAQEARSQSLRVICLIAAFLVGAVSSVYTGIKCIVFDFDAVPGEEAYMAPFLAGSIAIINFEYVCVKKLVASYVVEAGAVITPLHVHKLKFWQEGARASKRKWMRGGLLCDICRDNVGSKQIYNCAQCNWRICVTCFETKSGDMQGDEEENTVRGDKGKKAKTVLTSWTFMVRTIQLANGQLQLLCLAFSFLCVASLSGVMLPNFQGQILDQVILGDRDAFFVAMKYYIGFNVSDVWACSYF